MHAQQASSSMNTDEIARLIAMLGGDTPTPTQPAASWAEPKPLTTSEIEAMLAVEDEPEEAVSEPVVEEPAPEPDAIEVSEEEREAIEAAIVEEIVETQAAVEAEVIAGLQLDALKTEIYDAEPAEEIKPELVVTITAEDRELLNQLATPVAAPKKAKTKRAKFALDDTSTAALMSAMGTDEPADLAIEEGQSVADLDNLLQSFEAHKNKKQRERIVNIYHWLGDQGDLRIFTKQALDLVLDLRNGIKKSDLTDMYKSHGYAEKTAASQVSHYWALLQLMRCTMLATDGTMYKNDESLILKKRAQELLPQI